MPIQADAQRIQAAVARVTGINLPYTVQVAEGEGLTVTLKDKQAVITCDSVNSMARGFFLLSRCVREGKDTLSARQRRHFESCGVMADVSRNAVLTPEAARRLIEQSAALGMNLLMLYTEDTYEVPGYPYMGHLRGRYSLADLRALDDYAASFGVELVPCIQTLGHMAQFLQWQNSAPLRDQSDILLIDDEKVYRFIEAEIDAVRSCFRSSRIHIGMDEAHGVGFGHYWLQHGSVDRFELLNRHLTRVVDICKARGFHPIMWSDMFFRLGSKNNDYYDLDSNIPQNIIERIPDVDLCYWDYYHHDESFYDAMLTHHEAMGASIVFAGGIWTWSGFLPHVRRTEETMLPALRACAAHRVKMAFATLWGDDGAETDLFLASSRLPLFSEACWQGEDYTMAEVALSGECLTGLPDELFRAMGAFYPTEDEAWSGKQVIWCDLLYPLMYHANEPWAQMLPLWEDAARKLKGMDSRLDCRYAALLFGLMLLKAPILRDLRQKYLDGDKDYLRHVAEADIPALLNLYEQLMRTHRTLWERDCKRNGWEVLSLRYGATMGRLQDVQDELRRYLTGELHAVVELDEAPLETGTGRLFFKHYVTPSVIL